MKMIIVTGMSGAGKSTALNVLEDEGYYCVDNMPISLIPKFAELANAGEDGYSNIAIGVDIRSGHALAELDSVLDDMLNKHFNYTILFLESSDEVLVKPVSYTHLAGISLPRLCRWCHIFSTLSILSQILNLRRLFWSAILSRSTGLSTIPC